MANERQGRGTIAILGATAAAVVLVLLGVLNWEGSEAPGSADKTSQTPAQPAQNKAPSAQVPSASTTTPARPPAGQATDQTPPAAPKPAAETKAAAGEPIAPSFDIVRVEPNGDSVIAGRAAPGATIELLRDDQVHARGVADASGLFAITPPPLPTGSHQIVLQSIAPDGTRQRSRESVTVAINGNTRPLVALAAPDKPTVILSNPETPAPKTAEVVPSQPPANAAPQATPSAPAQTPPGQPAARAEIKIKSVEAEQGKLYVSGQAAPGATVRLYLNETFVAPGGAGGDGRLSFAIGSGVKPGDYRVRLDDIDPVSGQVKSRAEVAFNVPGDAGIAQVAQNPEKPAAPKAETAGVPASGGSATSAAGNQMASALPEGQLPPNTVVIPNINTAIVSRGDSLWRISQRIYGRGVRYTVIYGANQQQIRDPDLIYPGQVFVLPSDQGKATN